MYPRCHHATPIPRRSPLPPSLPPHALRFSSSSSSTTHDAAGGAPPPPPPNRRTSPPPPPSLPTCPVRSDVWSPASTARDTAAFESARPWPHVVLQDLCDPDRLRLIREEVITGLHATYKETDIYKLFQTGDLANMMRLDAETLYTKLPHLESLRRAIYGEEFRAYIRQVTGCPPLTDRTDLSCNIYTRGCHLLCHDDVIGTRAVSFIIYLTDPDARFTEEVTILTKVVVVVVVGTGHEWVWVWVRGRVRVGGCLVGSLLSVRGRSVRFVDKTSDIRRRCPGT